MTISKIHHRFIGLSATLRPEDVTDIMSRLSLNRAVVFRKSCFREGLGFNFHIVKSEDDAVEKAVAMALTVSEADSKVLVFATTVKTCEEIGAQIQSDDSFTG